MSHRLEKIEAMRDELACLPTKGIPADILASEPSLDLPSYYSGWAVFAHLDQNPSSLCSF